MATYFIGVNTISITGTTGDDVYIIDPDALGHATIVDLGGNDTLLVLDRPGRDSGELELSGTTLTWRNFEGDSVTMNLGISGIGMIETFEWQRHPNDGTPYSVRQTMAIDLNNFGAHSEVAGTAGDDVIVCPQLSNFVGGWSEVYGNRGNDSMTGSANHMFILLGGFGNDTLSGAGAFGDYFYGDAGADLLRGNGGNDGLNGGTGKDRIFGGAGNDTLFGDAGNDVLNGGVGADTFHFEPSETGSDTLVGYNGAQDTIQFSGFIESQITAVQSGANVAITYDSSSSILVKSTLLVDLNLAFV